MKIIVNFLTSLILAIWVGAIAVLSVQNFTSVTLKFLSFQSIEIPVGLVLAFSAGAGMIGGALLPILWQAADSSQQQLRSEEIGQEDEADF